MARSGTAHDAGGPERRRGRWPAIALWTAAVVIPAGVVGAVALRERDAAATESVAPTPAYAPAAYHPAFSRDGRHVVFAVSNDGVADVFVVCTDGGGLRRVATNGSPEKVSPAFSPDGKRVLYIGLDAERKETVSTVRVDGTGRKTLAAFDGVEPSFSPDGKRVAFELTPYSEKEKLDDPGLLSESDVYVMNLDGTDRRRLTKAENSDVDPAFSADGRQIAFSTHRTWGFGDEGGSEAFVEFLAIMNADGTNQRRLKLPAEGPLAYDLGSGGRTLFTGSFFAGSEGRGSSFVGVDAQDRVLLGPSGLADELVSPDGATVAFVAESRFGASDVFLADVDGTDRRKLTDLTAWYASVG